MREKQALSENPEVKVEAFLTHPPVQRNVAISTQNQVMNAAL
jgi:hypothetical protein